MARVKHHQRKRSARFFDPRLKARERIYSFRLLPTRQMYAASSSLPTVFFISVVIGHSTVPSPMVTDHRSSTGPPSRVAFGTTSRLAVGLSFQVCNIFIHPYNTNCNNDFKGSSLRILLVPVFLHVNWIIFTPLILSHPPPSPFAPLLFISYPTPSPTDDSTDPRYRKGWLDLAFLAYYVIFFSFVRQFILYKICYPIAQYAGIRKKGKLARFGEQGYAIIYFSFFGAWGLRTMSRLPTWWFNCQHFWIGTYVVNHDSDIDLRHPALGRQLHIIRTGR